MHLFHSALFSFLLSLKVEALNNRPIIAIFSLPSMSFHPACGGKCDMTAASYIKWLESAGARSVPVPYHASNAHIDSLFNSVNGLLFTGGGSSMSDSAKYFFKKIVDANQNGDYFPLWGTCLGFEWLLKAASGNDDICDTGFNSENYSIPLNLTDKATDCRVFDNDSKLLNILKTENVCMNNHKEGIRKAHFESTDKLTTMFNIISTNTDRDGIEFVSTIEGKELPIYGTQWHPEKNNFEWGEFKNGVPYEGINHSSNAIFVSQALSNFFVNEARQNKHRFPTPEQEQQALYYNYNVTETGPGFVQTYYMHF